jgi:hypothetical protein
MVALYLHTNRHLQVVVLYLYFTMHLLFQPGVLTGLLHEGKNRGWAWGVDGHKLERSK